MGYFTIVKPIGVNVGFRSSSGEDRAFFYSGHSCRQIQRLDAWGNALALLSICYYCYSALRMQSPYISSVITPLPFAFFIYTLAVLFPRKKGTLFSAELIDKDYQNNTLVFKIGDKNYDVNFSELTTASLLPCRMKGATAQSDKTDGCVKSNFNNFRNTNNEFFGKTTLTAILVKNSVQFISTAIRRVKSSVKFDITSSLGAKEIYLAMDQQNIAIRKSQLIFAKSANLSICRGNKDWL